MDRLKFWKRKAPAPHVEDVPVIPRFNIQPRTDVGSAGLPADPAKATRLVALRNRREALRHEVTAAEEASSEQNRWRTEISLIDQAISETDRDLSDLGQGDSQPGAPLPATPVSDVSAETDPVVQVRFAIAGEQFAFAEEIDWAERGHQIARSELQLVSGDVAALIPAEFSQDQRAALEAHLRQSLFVFASDIRDRTLEGNALPVATLADLARPSAEHGGWLDWAGQSANQQAKEEARHNLLAERSRLETERAQLVEDQVRTAENLPIARRRLADLEREIETLMADT